MLQNLPSAAVVIVALRVKIECEVHLYISSRPKKQKFYWQMNIARIRANSCNIIYFTLSWSMDSPRSLKFCLYLTSIALNQKLTM